MILQTCVLLPFFLRHLQKHCQELVELCMYCHWVGLMAGFEIEVLVIERGMLTKWPQNRSPDILFVDVCRIIRVGAVRDGPGSDFGRKPSQIQSKLKSVV